MGYECVVFDQDPLSGGMMRTQIPKFRLPEKVLDEECQYILDLGVSSSAAVKRVDSMKALLSENYDAIFVGCGAPRARSRHPPPQGSGEEHPYRHRLARAFLFGHIGSIGKRHRTWRRQHRDGLLPLLAPARR